MPPKLTISASRRRFAAPLKRNVRRLQDHANENEGEQIECIISAIRMTCGSLSGKHEISKIVPSELFTLSKETLERMQQKNPHLAANFHQFMVRFLAERLTFSNDIIEHLLH